MNFHLGNFVFTYFWFLGFLAPVALFGVPYRCWQLINGQLTKNIDSSPSPLARVAYFGILLIVVNVLGLLYACVLVLQIFTRAGTSGIMLMFIFVLIGAAYAFQELLLLPATLSKNDPGAGA